MGKDIVNIQMFLALFPALFFEIQISPSLA
jgi:hypothetical protein